MIIITTLTALLSGACNAALIALVNTSLNNAKWSVAVLVGGFVALVLGKTITNILSQVLLARFAQGAVSGLRRDLTKRILGVPLRQVESIGTHRILVALTDDVFNITQALLAIPIITVNVAILVGGAVYLGLLSWKILLGIGVLVVFGGISYRIMMTSAFKSLNAAREEEDKLFSYFRALTDGIKELKLHRSRRKVFLAENIHDTTETFQKYNVEAECRFIYAQNWNHLLFYLLVGCVLFMMPKMGQVSHAAMTGYVITILYLMGPLAGVMGSMSLFGRASIALQKVEELGLSLAAASTEEAVINKTEREVPFRSLELINVQHAYRHEKEDTNFVLGPIDLKFGPGELVFLVGGNGSGKSTLAKIVTGLYFPEVGEIRWNGKRVDNSNRDDYRQLFSAIFSDFYLFDNLMGLNRPDLDAKAKEYLVQLHLDHKISVKDGKLSTTSVSQGQRKRLALLTAYLEDRPFYLFDEWASDQDPLFKDVFYTRLLPELKARGKTCFVITHDDKYFYMADRVIKLDYGKMEHLNQLDGEALGTLIPATR
ncbi:cyclic peptide transporter [Pedosphaera parvula Ellin514]|uniref:Cyclic peptide transporter n=2 Tax=Pedosphaera TaxID=1032526 RepID=B9XGC9_PEDPL|nr:cyclic peptide transporter [Pedosphaera parvula Ellin514]